MVIYGSDNILEDTNLSIFFLLHKQLKTLVHLIYHSYLFYFHCIFNNSFLLNTCHIYIVFFCIILLFCGSLLYLLLLIMIMYVCNAYMYEIGKQLVDICCLQSFETKSCSQKNTLTECQR